MRDNRLAGAIVMGDGAIVPSLLQVFGDGSALDPNRAELLFPLSFGTPLPLPESMPDSAQICGAPGSSARRIA